MADKKSPGGKARSAIRGRYVKKSTANKNANTTVVEHATKRKQTGHGRRRPND